MNRTLRIIQNALFLSLIIISGKIAFPIAGISFTLQIFVVFLISFINKPLDNCFILFVYILLGLVGLPIFSVGGGLGYIYQPSFGFLIGFILMTLTISLFKKLFSKWIKNEMVVHFLSGMIGLIIDYILGCFYAVIVFNVFNHKDFTLLKVLQLVLIPFIGFDMLKLIVAVTTAKVVTKYKK